MRTLRTMRRLDNQSSIWSLVTIGLFVIAFLSKLFGPEVLDHIPYFADGAKEAVIIIIGLLATGFSLGGLKRNIERPKPRIMSAIFFIGMGIILIISIFFHIGLEITCFDLLILMTLTISGYTRIHSLILFIKKAKEKNKKVY